MLRLMGLAISIGIADSLNPSTIAPALYLASGERARMQVFKFTAGVFAVYLVGGAAIALGPGQLLLSLLPHPSRHTRGIVEVVVGAAMFVGGAFLWIRRHRLAERELPQVNAEGKSSALLGATITVVELPTAFPYFAVIAAVVGADLDAPRTLFVLVVFNVFFVAPLLAILAVLTIAPHNARRVLTIARRWLQEHWPQALSILLMVAGVFVILLGATSLSPRRSRFHRLMHRFHLH